MKKKFILTLFCFLFINGCNSNSNSVNWDLASESESSTMMSEAINNESSTFDISSEYQESSSIGNESISISESEIFQNSNEELSSTVENTDSSSGSSDEWLPDIRPN